MKPNVLAIDDEERWLENFKAWIPEKIAAQDSASTTAQAIELLRRKRYNVVLLDLSMDTNNTFNRSNRTIQEYLATRSEGTQYIVVSGTADKTDVLDSAFHLHAWYVIFKAKIEPTMIREKVIEAIEESVKQNNHLVADAKRKVTGTPGLDGRILATLNPKGGNINLYPLMESVLGRIAPVGCHKNRPHLEIYNNCVLGLVWSRQLGMAVSIALANSNVSNEELVRHLSEWIGYSHPIEPWFSRDIHRVRVRLFQEPNILDEHFELPIISASTA